MAPLSTKGDEHHSIQSHRKEPSFSPRYQHRQSQKGILIGKNGATMKKIGSAARVDIEEFLGRPVFLKIHVKVRDDWRNKDAMLRSFGFET